MARKRRTPPIAVRSAAPMSSEATKSIGFCPRHARERRQRGSDLDDRFHEGGNHGTDDLLADSSFAVSGTRSGIMARWRQAVEVAMTDEEIGSLTILSRPRTEPASRVDGAQMRLPTVRTRRSLRWGKGSACIT